MYHVRVSSHLESTPRILEVLGTTTGVVNVTVHPDRPASPTATWWSATSTPRWPAR